MIKQKKNENDSFGMVGVVDLAQEIFGVNVKLYVPNHMGLRNPVFTNVASMEQKK